MLVAAVCAGCRSDGTAAGAVLAADCGLLLTAESETVDALESSTTIVADSSLTPVAGIVNRGGETFAFDRIVGAVVRIAATGEVLRRLARSGRGPGELTPLTDYAVLSRTRASRDWLAARGDTVVILDGNAFHRYLADGAYLGSTRVPAAVHEEATLYPRETARLRARSSDFVVDVTTIRHTPGDRTRPPSRAQALWVVRDSSARLWFRRAVAAPPLTERGALVLSTIEARPLYDLAGDCAVLSDGGSPRLLLVSADGGRVDTVPIRTALREPRIDENERIARRLSGAGDAPLPPPSLPGRIRNLIVDPDGWVWLLPVQPEGEGEGVEVIRIHLGSGEEYVDRVPVFPQLFVGRDAYRAIEVDSLGAVRVRSFKLRR